jgi:hypothetical protein
MELRYYMDLNNLTAKDVSSILNEPLRTVEKWTRNERYPRPESQRKIIEMSKGMITAEAILNGFIDRKFGRDT